MGRLLRAVPGGEDGAAAGASARLPIPAPQKNDIMVLRLAKRRHLLAGAGSKTKQKSAVAALNRGGRIKK